MYVPHLPKIILVICVILAVLVCIAGINYAVIKYNGSPVAAPDIPRAAEKYGNGEPVTYVVLGDSTTISQGGDYDKGYARSSARFIASKQREVTFYNLGESGARAADVASAQAPKARELRPDIVLIAVGANDVMLIHLDFGENRFAQVLSSFAVPGSRGPALEVHGSEGTISINGSAWYDAWGPVDLYLRDNSLLGLDGWLQNVQPPNRPEGRVEHLLPADPCPSPRPAHLVRLPHP